MLSQEIIGCRQRPETCANRVQRIPENATRIDCGRQLVMKTDPDLPGSAAFDCLRVTALNLRVVGSIPTRLPLIPNGYNRKMNAAPLSFDEALKSLVDRYRIRCLWFLRTDFYPATLDERLRVLDYLQRYGDRDAFVQAADLRQWLSRLSNAESAAS